MEESDFSEAADQNAANAEEELDPNNPEHEFAIMEKDYTKTMADMEEDPNALQYAEEYSKLFDYLFKTHENEQALVHRTIDLTETLQNNESQLQTAMKIVKNDEFTIASLTEQIQKAWTMTDNAHAREQAAQEIIDNLRRQIANLNAEIEFKNKMGQQDVEENPQVQKQKESLQREKEKLMSEVSKLNEKLNNALTYQEELEKRTSVADMKINELVGTIEDTSAEVDRYKRNKDRLEEELLDLRDDIAEKESKLSQLNDVITTSVKQTAKYEATIKDQQNIITKFSKDSENWNSKLSKLQDEYDSVVTNELKLKKEYATKCTELKMKDEERARLNIDLSKLSKQKEIGENRIRVLEDDREEINLDRNQLRQMIANIEKELDHGKRQADQDKRNIETLTREKDLLNKSIVRQQAVGRDHIKLIKLQEQTKHKLEVEIDLHVLESRKKQKQISYLEKERDRLLEEELDLTKKIEDTLDDIRLKKSEIYNLKKNLAENDNKLRMQQNLFDAVRADRNALQKSLQESTAETGELKKKLKIGSHQTEQLKEDISAKELLLLKEENILRKVNKEKDNLKIELNNANDDIRNLKDEIAENNAEEKRLHKVIITGDRTIRQQAKDLTQLMNERDILGSQLVRRNDELSLLYEKIKILQTTLHRGEAQYDQRLLDIKLLKVEIKRLRQEKNLLTKSISNMNDLRQEVFHLERDLTRERLKSKALEDELQNPMNIHRWRKLEGSDPEMLELLQKIQLLQKRLLKQSSEAIERERQLKEVEKLYAMLRGVVDKQPGPEMQKQLNKTQKALRGSLSKMKCLASELNMIEIQAKDYKIEKEQVQGELKALKKKFITEKKDLRKSVDYFRHMSIVGDNTRSKSIISSDAVKFSGGGFRMSVAAANQ